MKKEKDPHQERNEKVAKHKKRLQKLLAEVVEVFNMTTPVTDYDHPENVQIDDLNQSFKSIISAIRGPDFPNSRDVKWGTTAKIRYAIGMRETCKLDVNPDTDITWFRDNRAIIEDKSFHFSLHISDARRGIKELLGIDLIKNEEPTCS